MTNKELESMKASVKNLMAASGLKGSKFNAAREECLKDMLETTAIFMEAASEYDRHPIIQDQASMEEKFALLKLAEVIKKVIAERTGDMADLEAAGKEAIRILRKDS